MAKMSPDKVEPGSEGSQAVQRAMAVLTAFLHYPEPYMGLADLARQCRLTPSTTHRLVSALVKTGYLAQDKETTRYYLGPKAFQLGRKAMKDLDMAQRALPIMRQLAQTVRASVNLGILQYDKAVYIQKVESPQALQLNLPIGTMVPLHCSAIGKVLLAMLPAHLQRKILHHLDLEGLQPNSMKDHEMLEAHLKMIQQQGFAVDDEEFLAGVICLGAPIRVEDDVVAALAMQFPKVHIGPGGVVKYLPMLFQATKDIEKTLGG